MRLQKYISRSGVTSRRKAEDLIKQGKIKVNGKVISEMGFKVNTDKDIVEYQGEIIKPIEDKTYIILNKPVGYVTTVDDEKNRPTVMDLVEDIKDRIYPVGRLDMDSSGLLLLTNDGIITNKLTHPSNEIEKVYLVEVEGIPSEDSLNRFRKGLIIDGRKTWPAEVELTNKSSDKSLLKVTIHEGRNRQVRKMCSAIGHPVKRLKRIEIGAIKLGNLNTGEWRYLTKSEKKYLKEIKDG